MQTTHGETHITHTAKHAYLQMRLVRKGHAVAMVRLFKASTLVGMVRKASTAATQSPSLHHLVAAAAPAVAAAVVSER